MKYRSKLCLLLLSLLCLTLPSGLGVLYSEGRKALFYDLQSKVRAIAATVARAIDGEALARLQQGQVDPEAFRSIVQQLIEARDRNRREDLYVVWLYTLRPTGKGASGLELVLDISEEAGEEYALTYEAFPQGVQAGLLEHLHEVWSPPLIVSDHWGSFLSGYAPIYDRQGNYVATLGVDIQAKYVREEQEHLLYLVVGVLFLAFGVAVIVAYFLSRFVTRSLEVLYQAVQKIGQGDLSVSIDLKTKDEFAQVASSLEQMTKKLRTAHRLKAYFVCYVSKQILDQLVSSEQVLCLEGERRWVVVLFAGIQGLEEVIQKHSAEEVIDGFNAFLKAMVETVFSFGGTLDKFTQEGLMVEFGAPLAQEHPERQAALCALEMQKAFSSFCSSWSLAQESSLRLRMGIHAGFVVIGDIGSEQKRDYTAIGDVVNVASRLEQMAQDPSFAFLMTETVRQKIDREVSSVHLGSLSLRGRSQLVEVYAAPLSGRGSISGKEI